MNTNDFEPQEKIWFNEGENLDPEDFLQPSFLNQKPAKASRISEISSNVFSKLRGFTRTKTGLLLGGFLGFTGTVFATDQLGSDNFDSNTQQELLSIENLPQLVSDNTQAAVADLTVPTPTEEEATPTLEAVTPTSVQQLPAEVAQISQSEQVQPEPEPETEGQLGQQPSPTEQAEAPNLQRFIVRNPGLSTVAYTAGLEGALIQNPQDLTSLSIPANELAGTRLVASSLITGVNIRQIRNDELDDTKANVPRNYDQLTALGQVVIGVKTDANGVETPIAYLHVANADNQRMWIAATSLRVYSENSSDSQVTEPTRTSRTNEAGRQNPEPTGQIPDQVEPVEADEQANSDQNQNLDQSPAGIEEPIGLTEAEMELTEADLEEITPEEAEHMRSLQRAYELAYLGFNSIAVEARNYLLRDITTPTQNSRLMQVEALAIYISNSAALKGLVRGTHSVNQLTQIIPEIEELATLIQQLQEEGIVINIPEALLPVFNFEFAVPEFNQEPIANVYRRLESLMRGYGQFTDLLDSEAVRTFTYNNTDLTTRVERLIDLVGSAQDTLAVVMSSSIGQSQPILNNIDLITALLNYNQEIIALYESLSTNGLPVQLPEVLVQNLDLSYLIPSLEYGNGIEELPLGLGHDFSVQVVPAQEPAQTQKSLHNKEVSYQKFIDELSDSSLNQQYIGRQFEYTTKNGKTSVYTFKGVTKTGKIELKMPNSNLSIKINPSTLKARPNAIAEVDFINWDDAEFTESADSIDDIQFVTKTNIEEVTE